MHYRHTSVFTSSQVRIISELVPQNLYLSPPTQHYLHLTLSDYDLYVAIGYRKFSTHACSPPEVSLHH